jgi:hypothetical protein
MKVVEEIKSKEDFIEMFKDECISVRYHISLVRNQYKEIRNLKENLGRCCMYGQVRQKYRQRIYDLFRFHHWGFGSKQPRGAESP